MVNGDPWSALISQAVLGARQGQALSADGQLGEALARVPSGDLPTAVALITAWRRAGRRARHVAQAPTAAPEETLREVTPTASRLLQRFLAEGGERELAAQWITACAAAQQRVPAILVPALLDLGRNQPTVRDDLRRLMGARGAWLAAQHEAWTWATAPASTGSWATSTASERLGLLRTVRAQNPTAACDLITSTWSEDAPPDRAAFLVALRQGLSLADEPLLERALDDRRKEVREAALDLCYQLPTSGLARRCQERLAPYWSWARKLFGKRLQVEPPAAYDKTWARDGIDEKPPKGIGERAWWLQQLIASVPVTVWSTSWGIEPAAILTAVAATEWAEPVRNGLLTACERQPDPSWVAAFLALEEHAGHARLLLARLPRTEQQVLLLKHLPSDGKGRITWLEIVSQLPTHWDLAFSKQVVAVMQPLPVTGYASTLLQLARHLHPDCVSQVGALRRDDTTIAFIDQALAMLDLRRQILQEFP